jgi:rhodanese-related sulfurtransferase
MESSMRKKPLLILLAAVVLVVFAATAMAAAPPADTKKHTKLGLYVTAQEAFDMWSANKDKVKVLDCRTPEEYAFVGHAPMAYNVPSRFMTYVFDAEKKDYNMKVNDAFVEQVKAKLKAEDTILVMCRSGQRSAMSVNLLAEAGFKQVYNIVDGFEGDKEKDKASPNSGKRTVDGWRNSKAPWTYDLDAALVYQPDKK